MIICCYNYGTGVLCMDYKKNNGLFLFPDNFFFAARISNFFLPGARPTQIFICGAQVSKERGFGKGYLFIMSVLHSYVEYCMPSGDRKARSRVKHRVVLSTVSVKKITRTLTRRNIKFLLNLFPLTYFPYFPKRQ